MIIGERVRFRFAEKSDLPNFVLWLNDPEVRRGLSIIFPMSTDLEEKWYEENKARPPREQALMVEAKTDETWQLIGSCGLFQYDDTVRSAELGILIGDKTFWDQGYGTETMKMLIAHGFNTVNLHRIYLRVFSFNDRARHVYEKIGFVHEGTMRDAIYYNGEYHHVHFMSILRHEWDLQSEE